jgi:hypothetical protein
MPCALKPSSSSSSAALSFSFRLAVGSSRISSLTFFASALAISTNCCLPTPEVGNQRVRRFIQPDLAQQLDGSRMRTLRIDDAVPCLLVAQEDVLGDRQQRHQRQFLVNDDDPLLFAVANASRSGVPPLQENLAVIGAGGIHPTQHFHQGRFAGAVLATDGMNFAGLDHQIHVFQGDDTWKTFGDPLHFENRSHCSLPQTQTHPVQWAAPRKPGETPGLRGSKTYFSLSSV